MVRFQKVSRWIAIGLAAGIPLAWGAPPTIGFVTARGTIQLDASPIDRNGTLFEGSTIETRTIGSQLEIAKEAKVFLGSESRAQVFRDHMILDRGDTELSQSSHYWIQTRGLRIGAMAPGAVATVSLRKDRQVQVTAFGGSVSITNLQGVLIAQVQDGRTAQVDTPDDGTTPTSKKDKGAGTPSSGAAPAATATHHGVSTTAVVIVSVAAVGGVAAIIGVTRPDSTPISQ